MTFAKISEIQALASDVRIFITLRPNQALLDQFSAESIQHMAKEGEVWTNTKS